MIYLLDIVLQKGSDIHQVFWLRNASFSDLFPVLNSKGRVFKRRQSLLILWLALCPDVSIRAGSHLVMSSLRRVNFLAAVWHFEMLFGLRNILSKSIKNYFPGPLIDRLVDLKVMLDFRRMNQSLYSISGMDQE